MDVDRTQRDHRRPVHCGLGCRAGDRDLSQLAGRDFAPGSLRITAGDLVIDPGCCVGLDEWRDWARVISGEVIYLGHDPDQLVAGEAWQKSRELLGEFPTRAG